MSSPDTQAADTATDVATAQSDVNDTPAHPALTFADLVQSETSLYNLRTRLQVIISPREHGTLSDVVTLNDVNYSFHSPLKKGDGSYASPKGILRDALLELTQYLGEFNSASAVTLLGDSATVQKTIVSLADRVRTEIEPILLSFNNGKETFTVPANLLKSPEAAEAAGDIPDDVEAGEELGDANDTTPVKFHAYEEVLTISVWPTVVEDTIEIVVSVNIVCPILAGVEDLKTFTTIHNIISKYAESNNVGVDNYTTCLILDSDTLLLPSTQSVLAAFSEEGVDSIVVGTKYFYDSAFSGVDEFGLYPTDMTVADAVDTVFAFGGDILVVARSFPKVEAAPVKAKSALPVASSVPGKKKKKFKRV